MAEEYSTQVYTVSGTSGQATTKTFAADRFWAHGISQIHCGYSGDPTSGSLTISNGGVVEYVMPITKGGAAPIYFDPPYCGDKNSAVVVALSGGGAVVGYLNIWEFLR